MPHTRRIHSTRPSLILLFGIGRSGTTWLGKIFDSHPDTLYRHEPDSRGTLNALPLFAAGPDAESYRDFLEDYIARLPAIRSEKVAASLPIFPKSYYSPKTLALRRLFAFGLKAAARVGGSMPAPDWTGFHRRRDITLVWKSIESLGRLGVIARIRPDARCLLIVRHPCGYAASVLHGEAKRKFESGTPTHEDWGIFDRLLALPKARELGLDLAQVRAMAPVERLALKWALYHEHALAHTEGLDNVLPVRYEDFCERPIEETRRAFQYCRLPWNPATERFIAHSTAQDNGDYYSVFKNPRVSADKWRDQLSSWEVSRILAIVGQFRAGSLYPSGNTPTLPPRLHGSQSDQPAPGATGHDPAQPDHTSTSTATGCPKNAVGLAVRP